MKLNLSFVTIGNSFWGKGKLSVLLHKTKISMRKSICLAIILAVFCMEEVPAQKIAKTKENPAVKAYSDSLSALSASYFAYFRLWDDLNIPAPRRVRPIRHGMFLLRLFISCLFRPLIMKLL